MRVLVPATTVVLGSSDWEAEGRIAARTVRVAAFRLSAFEATRGAAGLAGAASPAGGPTTTGDPRATRSAGQEHEGEDSARALTGISRGEAAEFCADRGGRLPTEDEWIAAATSGSSPPRRYPWGDTGAVCRRAAWGLLSGPCASGGDGPDTVGAHPDGDSPLGIHDLSGNAAEWVAPDEEPGSARPASGARVGIAKGGSWESSLASDLRVWARIELDPEAHDARVGVRCAYPP